MRWATLLFLTFLVLIVLATSAVWGGGWFWLGGGLATLLVCLLIFLIIYPASVEMRTLSLHYEEPTGQAWLDLVQTHTPAILTAVRLVNTEYSQSRGITLEIPAYFAQLVSYHLRPFMQIRDVSPVVTPPINNAVVWMSRDTFDTEMIRWAMSRPYRMVRVCIRFDHLTRRFGTTVFAAAAEDDEPTVGRWHKIPMSFTGLRQSLLWHSPFTMRWQNEDVIPLPAPSNEIASSVEVLSRLRFATTFTRPHHEHDVILGYDRTGREVRNNTTYPLVVFGGHRRQLDRWMKQLTQAEGRIITLSPTDALLLPPLEDKEIRWHSLSKVYKSVHLPFRTATARGLDRFWSRDVRRVVDFFNKFGLANSRADIQTSALAILTTVMALRYRYQNAAGVLLFQELCADPTAAHGYLSNEVEKQRGFLRETLGAEMMGTLESLLRDGQSFTTILQLFQSIFAPLENDIVVRQLLDKPYSDLETVIARYKATQFVFDARHPATPLLVALATISIDLALDSLTQPICLLIQDPHIWGLDGATLAGWMERCARYPHLSLIVNMTRFDADTPLCSQLARIAAQYVVYPQEVNTLTALDQLLAFPTNVPTMTARLIHVAQLPEQTGIARIPAMSPSTKVGITSLYPERPDGENLAA